MNTVGGGQSSVLVEPCAWEMCPRSHKQTCAVYFWVQLPILCDLILHGNWVLDAWVPGCLFCLVCSVLQIIASLTCVCWSSPLQTQTFSTWALLKCWLWKLCRGDFPAIAGLIAAPPLLLTEQNWHLYFSHYKPQRSPDSTSITWGDDKVLLVHKLYFNSLQRSDTLFLLSSVVVSTAMELY